MPKRIKERKRHSTSQLLNFAKDSYLDRTSRPIYAIIFLLPFIIFYEVGTILINTDMLNQSQVRVVAFVWLQNLLEYMGSSDKLAWVARNASAFGGAECDRLQDSAQSAPSLRESGEPGGPGRTHARGWRLAIAPPPALLSRNILVLDRRGCR